MIIVTHQINLAMPEPHCHTYMVVVAGTKEATETVDSGTGHHQTLQVEARGQVARGQVAKGLQEAMGAQETRMAMVGVKEALVVHQEISLHINHSRGMLEVNLHQMDLRLMMNCCQ